MAHREWTERHIRELVQRELKKKKSDREFASITSPRYYINSDFMQYTMNDLSYPNSWTYIDPMELPNEFYTSEDIPLPNNQIRITMRGYYAKSYATTPIKDENGDYAIYIYLVPNTPNAKYGTTPTPPLNSIRVKEYGKTVERYPDPRFLLIGEDLNGDRVITEYIIEQDGKYFLPQWVFGQVFLHEYPNFPWSNYKFNYIKPYDYTQIKSWESSAIGFFTDWTEFIIGKSCNLIYNGWYLWNS